MHQDEVSFVFGQPIFMFSGYTNCSVPGWDGYDPGCLGCHYNKEEAVFARQVGRFWSNMWGAPFVSREISRMREDVVRSHVDRA
jgi:hypothetical protein